MLVFRCALRNVTPPPYAVSLSAQNVVFSKTCKTADNLNLLHLSQGRSNESLTFTVCVSPIYRYDNVHQLVEFIEAHRLFGVQKFVFYNMSAGANVTRYLNFYQRQGVVDILPWNFPSTVDGRTHYHAQVVMLHDCLYRYMFKSKYVAFLDLDEIIVPRKHYNWTDMISSMATLPRRKTACAFTFQCVFFRTDWADNSTVASNKAIKELNIQSLLKLKRETKIWPHHQRSKFIAIARKVETVGIHFVGRGIGGFNEKFVPFEIGAVHHYRRFEDLNFNRIEDATMLTFKTPLLQRIQRVQEQIGRHH